MQSGTLNGTLIRWIVDVNLPGAPYPTVRRPRPTEQDKVEALRKSRAERLQAEIAAVVAASAAGFVPEDPAAPLDDQMEGRWLRAAQPAQALPSPAFAAPVLLPPHRRDSVDDLADQLDQAAAPAMDAMIGAIRDLMGEVAAVGGGLDEVARRLAALHPTLPTAPLADLIAQAMQVAELTGRLEIMDGVA